MVFSWSCIGLSLDNVRGKEHTHDIKTKRIALYEWAFGQRPLLGKGFTDANIFKFKESPVKFEVER